MNYDFFMNHFFKSIQICQAASQKFLKIKSMLVLNLISLLSISAKYKYKKIIQKNVYPLSPSSTGIPHHSRNVGTRILKPYHPVRTEENDALASKDQLVSSKVQLSFDKPTKLTNRRKVRVYLTDLSKSMEQNSPPSRPLKREISHLRKPIEPAANPIPYTPTVIPPTRSIFDILVHHHTHKTGPKPAPIPRAPAWR